jgi:hypothetical protein
MGCKSRWIVTSSDSFLESEQSRWRDYEEKNMRCIAAGFLSLMAVGALLFVAPKVQSQSPERNDRPQSAQRGRGGNERPPRRGGGRGGFPIPPPPVLATIDTNNDGVISAEELKNASAALKKLDKNKDGEIADAELRPDFRGGFGFPGGGRGGFNPFGGGNANVELLAPEKVEFRDGAATIPDHATFQKLSYQGEEVLIDTFLAGLEFVKFTLEKAASDKRQLYFINTKTHRAHMMFARIAGLSFGRGNDQMKGVLVYRPLLKSPSGRPGLYTFEFEPFDTYSFKMVKTCQDVLIAKMPILKGNIGYYPRDRGIAKYEDEKSLYDGSDVTVYLEEDLNNTDLGYLPLNLGETFGRLRMMEIDERPSPRDVVLYKFLPNELPRVAGIITSVRQTPLSHVNLRAVQDKIPNAFITEAAGNKTIRTLIGRYVSYKVTAGGYEIREATTDEVAAHFAHLRPARKQVAQRDLSVTNIRPLDEVKFEDSSSFGVKAANLATMHTFGFSEGIVPNGFAVPFYFYDEFMKYNGFYKFASELLANPKFQQDRVTQEAQLKKFRKLIKKGKMPSWMMEALDTLHKSYPDGTSLRCRSSTNNEDLPGFSGAGLYDSYTQHPKEGHFSKSIKQVYAGLWNFRAFEEREFYRVDHFTAAMGVLVHPNFKGELANGVAVSDDILYQTYGNYYLNTQVGENLVTNPDEASIPEEVLLDWWDSSKYQVMRTSNRADDGKPLLSAEHLEQLRHSLSIIHGKFARLYGKSPETEHFSMEIEFKITRKGKLAIKQARPWVYTQPEPTQD